ncbi:uncharacterized protein LOC122498671 [Leptopilina heterotoma]|uniref:uncharacterized protein LOC122498671 n=1 Tax=Leptopilina heterotoma TaxID=63436 RepID=UPI001CA853BF|nr:uncharacterized protein LOC122498671 [Leptopilina heterotoma]
MTYYQSGLLILLLALSNIQIVYNEDDTLWCYECNTNLKKERTQECNDPFAGRSGDLIQCSQNGSQQCLKSIITYKSRHTTVRGCVSSSKIENYCNFKDFYPDAEIECHFCSSYGCNSSISSICNNFIIFVTILLIFNLNVLLDF